MQSKAVAAKPFVDNNLLAALRPDDIAMLLPSLERWNGSVGDVLYEPGEDVNRVYFPCGESLVGFAVLLDDGQAVETALVGREGAVGGVVSHGLLPAFSRSQVRSPGQFLRMSTRDLEAAKRQSPSLRNLLVRYADCLVAQVFQAVACNVSHPIDQRFAKWLVAARDRTGEDRFELTQDELAMMLGVGRSYLSRVVQAFKARGLIDVGRRSITICDAAALERASCQCNGAVRRHFETVLEGIYPSDEEVEPAVARMIVDAARKVG